MINLTSFVGFHARTTPDHPALIYQDRNISWAEFNDRVLAMAGLLQRRGIGKGDVVAVFMKNSPAFLETMFATSHLGGIFLPINYRLAGDEIGYILGNADAVLLIVDEEFAGIADFPDQLVLGAAAQADIRTLAEGERAADAVDCTGSDVFRLMYTSGTTDHPKGVPHTYDNFYWKCMDHTIVLGLSASSRLLVVGPLYHVGACDLPGIGVLRMGGTLCLHRDFDATETLSSIDRHQLNCGWMAPTMTNAVLNLPDADQYDVSSLKWLIGGGERTPEQRIRQFTDRFPNARYIDGYGLTESVSGDTLMEAGREIEKIGSTGRPTPHVQVAILDADGNLLPPGEEGEIALKGPKVVTGYWKAPEKTAEAFQNGWFRTGDVGLLDEDGFLFLTDRKKDMILSGGENIASSEVERVIYDLPQVLEAAVIGLPDDKWGERPVAVVVLQPGTELSFDQLTTHCRASLAGFKVPKELRLVTELPRNPSGKVLKRALREQFDDA